MTNHTILITGGTGRTGGRIVQRLTSLGSDVRVASRTRGVRFDWHDDSTWDAALAGASAAYLCFSPDLALPGTDALIGAFAARAVSAGVERLVLLSGRGEDAARACEDAVLAASSRASVVRSSFFQENFSEGFFRDAVVAGRLRFPAGDTPEPFVSLDDVADVATLALTSDRFACQVLEVTGPRALSFGGAAAALSVATGRRIVHEDVSAEEFVSEAVAAGVDPEEADFIAWLFGEVLDGRNVATTSTVERILGRPARAFEDYARDAAAAGAWAAAPAA